jgi:LPS export ABC transporter protein LptC
VHGRRATTTWIAPWVAAALGCGSPLEALDVSGRAPVQIPPIALEQVVFEGYHGDLRDLSVTAASAVVDTATQIAHLSDVAIGFAGDESGRVEISAPVGEFRLDGDDFALSGGVSGSTGEGERFTTDAVQYVAKRRLLHSDAPVVIARSNVEISGTGMELELAHQKLRLLGSVRARVKPQ